MKKSYDAASGLSHLTKSEMEKYQGKCVGIVDGEVRFSGKNAGKVIEKLKNAEGEDKSFTCVPKGSVTIVK